MQKLKQISSSAYEDIVHGLRRYPVWLALAYEGIGDQHRKTTLGPLWLVLNYLLFAGAFVIIFGQDANIQNFSAYVACGLYVWLLLSEAISMSVPLFKSEASYIQGTTLPLFVYVMRLATQTLLRGLYSGAGLVVLMLLLTQPSVVQWAMASLGMLTIIVWLPALVAVFAITGVFFPDFEFIANNLIRVGMFLTPIFWIHDQEGGLRQIFYDYNPFTYFLALVREPLVYNIFPFDAFGICAAIIMVTWFLAIYLLGSLRNRVVFAL